MMSSSSSSGNSSTKLALPAMMASVVVSAVANTIVRRIALVPMQRYPYFLTQLQTLVYVFFYTGILYLRYQRRDGTVTDEMLQIRKSPFIYIGFWDSLGDMLGNVGTSRLPGYQVPLLAKLNIVFTAIFSNILLGKRYSSSQVAAMTVVLCGSIVTLIPTIFNSATLPTTSEGSSSSFSDLFYAGVYVASVAPTALAFVLKEQVFRENRHLNLDIFVVNSYGAMVGLIFTICLLPLAAVPGLGKVELSQIPAYMKNGAICFVGQSPDDDYDCTGAPVAPLLYFGINLVYNICFLNLIKHGGALLTFITNTVTFPLSTILFTLPWPLLGASSLNIYVILGLMVELSGIVLYQRASSAVVMEQEKMKTESRQSSSIATTENDQTALLPSSTAALSSNNDKEYGAVAVNRCGGNSANDQVEADYLEQEPPLCYNKCLRSSIDSNCCNKEDICKCLLSNKCNCG